MPIPIGSARRAHFCRELIERSRTLPDLQVRLGDGGHFASITLGRNPDIGAVAYITCESDLVVRLSPALVASLRERGWVASSLGSATVVHGPRTPGERDVAWQIILEACACAGQQRLAADPRAEPVMPLLAPAVPVTTL